MAQFIGNLIHNMAEEIFIDDAKNRTTQADKALGLSAFRIGFLIIVCTAAR